MADLRSATRRHEDYTVAIICAIGFEMSAVRYMLDREHPRLKPRPGDSNMYVLGELSGHNVALACLPGTQGKGAAATVTTNIERTFPSIKWRFLVGIGGGVPSDEHDIRLGDVVVSMPEGQYGGVVQYDLGKDLDDGFRLKGFLLPPPAMIRGAVELMRSDHLVADNKLDTYLSQMFHRGSRLSIYQRPSRQDVLFDANYPHVAGPACNNCDLSKTVNRQPRPSEGSMVHYGLIASGDRVMRSAVNRGVVAGSVGDILCFEMEAAGIATEFPCIIIRGVSDYADSHKNDAWQHYAAAAAAATAKELLSYVPAEQPCNDAAPGQPETDPLVTKLLKDVEKFVRGHRSAMEQAMLREEAFAIVLGQKTEGVRDISAAGITHSWCPRGSVELGSGIFSLVFSPDGTKFVSVSRKPAVQIWDTETGKLLQTLEGNRSYLNAVAFSPDGTTLVVASQEIWLWDLNTGAQQSIYRLNSVYFNAVATFSPGGRTLAFGFSNGNLQVYDRQARMLRGLPTNDINGINAVEFSHDGATLASVSIDHTIRLWDLATNTLRHSFRGDGGQVSAIAFSPCGKTLALASADRTIRLLDTATGTGRYALKGYYGPILAMAFSPDGKTLAAASADHSILFWDATRDPFQPKLQVSCRIVTTLAFSPNKKTLVSGTNDGKLQLWDAFLTLQLGGTA